GFLLFDPVSGQIQALASFANLSKTLPVAQNTFPGQILETQMTTSSDGWVIWGVGGGGTGTQVIYQYNGHNGSLYVSGDVSSPSLLPRVSVSSNGANAMIGWALFSSSGYIQARYPN